MNFSHFSSHLELAHSLWKDFVRPTDIVLDLTVGNGYDAQFLLELNPRKIIGIDIQEKALKNTRQRILSDKLELILADHASFPGTIADNSIRLAVYNLGYLPGSDKIITTLSERTLQSVELMLKKLATGGALSITCYPGHEEGRKEEETLLAWAKNLPGKQWQVTYTQWINRNKSPSLLWIIKKENAT